MLTKKELTKVRGEGDGERGGGEEGEEKEKKNQKEKRIERKQDYNQPGQLHI